MPLKYSIVIPAYNEEKRIGNLLSDLSNPDDPMLREGEFIFVCEGNDKTPDLINKFKMERPYLTIKCLDNFHKRLGKGGAVYEGFSAATAPIVGFMDADNSTTYSEMMRLLTFLDDHDGIIGSRHMPGSLIDTHQPFTRRLQSRVFNLLIRTLFGLQYYDTQCGAKFFRRGPLFEILPKLRAKGFEFDVDLLWQMKRNGSTIIEVPTTWNHMDNANLQFQDTFAMLATLLRLRLGVR